MNAALNALSHHTKRVLDQQYEQALRLILRICLAALTVLLLVRLAMGGAWSNGALEGTLAMLALWLGIVASGWLQHRGRFDAAAFVFVIAVMANGAYGAWRHGTVASPALLTMFVGIVAGGTFLRARALTIAVLIGLLGFATLAYMQVTGLMPTPAGRTSLTTWLTSPIHPSS